MASDRQIEANRQNAQYSTGPRTPEGKAVSRRNALFHGLTAEELLLDGEDLVSYNELREAIDDEFQPGTPYEAELTDRMISLLWRLRRVPILASTLLQWMAFRQSQYFNSEDSVFEQFKKEQIWHRDSQLRLRPGDHGHSERTNQRLTIGRLLEAALDKQLISKLDRHEANLMRLLQKTRAELQKVKESRPFKSVDHAVLPDDGPTAPKMQLEATRDNHDADGHPEAEHADGEPDSNADIDGDWVIVNGKKEPRIGPP